MSNETEVVRVSSNLEQEQIVHQLMMQLEQLVRERSSLQEHRDLCVKRVAAITEERNELTKKLADFVPLWTKVVYERDVFEARAKALQAENAAIRELMNIYNLGGWTDSLALIKERDALQAKLTALEGQEPAGWTIPKERYSCVMPGPMQHFPASTTKSELFCMPLYRAAGATPAELDALKQDAERYRWLKEYIEYKPAHYDGRNAGRFDFVWDSKLDDLDAAIDAAKDSK